MASTAPRVTTHVLLLGVRVQLLRPLLRLRVHVRELLVVPRVLGAAGAGKVLRMTSIDEREARNGSTWPMSKGKSTEDT